MSLDDYGEPKGAYYNAALVARFPDEAGAESAVDALRAAGFTQRDIQVARGSQGVTVVVSEPTPGMLEEAGRLLHDSAATDVRPYGSGSPLL
jgi:hypothetical protein